MTWLPLVNGIMLGLLSFFLFKLRQANRQMIGTNRMLMDQVIAMGFATTMMLDRSCGMIACDVCGDSLRPGQNLRADISPGEQILAHAECE